MLLREVRILCCTVGLLFLVGTTLGADPAGGEPGNRQEQPRFRTWTDSTGKYAVEAEFVGIADGQNLPVRNKSAGSKEKGLLSVRLKKTDGHIITVPFAKLSREDQDFITAQPKNLTVQRGQQFAAGPVTNPADAVVGTRAAYIVFFSEDAKSGEWHFDMVVEPSIEQAKAYLNKPLVQGISIAYCRVYDAKTWGARAENLLRIEKSRILASVNAFRVQEARSTGKRAKKLRFDDLAVTKGDHPLFGAKALQAREQEAANQARERALSVNHTQWESQSPREGGRVEIVVFRFYHSGILDISVRRKQGVGLGIVRNEYKDYVGKWQQNGDAITITQMYEGEGWDAAQGARATGSGMATRSGDTLKYEGFAVGNVTLHKVRWMDGYIR